MASRSLSPRVAAGLAALLLFAMTAAAARAAGPSVQFEQHDGDKVADVATVVARATTDDPEGIQKVEFYLDDELKSTDTSTPYSMDWDTLAGVEGQHVVTAKAYDSKGGVATAKVTLVVDNELGKGADAYADAALAALKSGDVDTAARVCRRALKIDSGNLRAARAMAGIYRQKGELAQAIATIEKATIPAEDTQARADLVSLHILSAEAADGTEGFLKEADAAVAVYKQLQAAKAAAAKATTDPVEAATRRGDAAYAAANWADAVSSYQQCGTIEDMPVRCANRLVLAYMNAGRFKEADGLLRTLVQSKRADETTHAILALRRYETHDRTSARNEAQIGASANSVPALLVGAYVDLSFKDRKKAKEKADQLAQLAPDLPEVHLLQSFLITDAIDAHKEVIAALQGNPQMPQAYAMLALQTLMSNDKGRFGAAEALLEFAAKLDPTNAYVNMVRLISALAQRRAPEAEVYLAKVRAMDPDGPDVHTVAAAYYSLVDKQMQVTEELNKALKLDPDNWNFAMTPKPEELMRDVFRYRYPLTLSPSVLYMPQG